MMFFFLYCKEKVTEITFMSVISNSNGKNKSANYKKVVEKLILAYNHLGCNIPLCKICLLHSHLNFFRLYLGAVCDKHGDFPSSCIYGKKYQGKCINACRLLVDNCKR